MQISINVLFAAKNDDAKNRERRKTIERRTRSVGSLPDAKYAIKNDSDNVQLVCWFYYYYYFFICVLGVRYS